MNKILCERCKKLYQTPNGFNGGDYTLCDKCGRLLVSFKREKALRPTEKPVPKVLFIGNDISSMWSLRRALYDPREYSSNTDSSEVVFGFGGSSIVYSKNGNAAEVLNIVEPNPEEKFLFRWMINEEPTIAVLILDCTKKRNITNYIWFLKNYIKVMHLTSTKESSLVVVLDKADEVNPKNEKYPMNYSEEKELKIREMIDNYRDLFTRNSIDVDDIFPVSSYVKWGIKPGVDPKKGIKAEDLDILVDGRFNINRLRRLIDDSVRGN